MAISPIQKAAIEEIFDALKNITQGGRYKRHLTDAFLELPDKEEWADYYEIIPQPRSLNIVHAKLQAENYDNCLAAYADLALVFLNALHYNEEGSQIAQDAEKLRGILLTEWKARQVLPAPTTTPPPEAPPKAQPAAPATVAQSTPLINPPLVKPELLGSTVAPRPQTQPAVAPALRPLSIRPRSPSPDADVDVERGTPEPEGPVEEEARDEESQAIITQLERGLPRWEGLEDVGWNESIPEDRFLEIILALKNHKDVVTGIRLSATLEGIPEQLTIPELPYTAPLSLKLMENKARAKSYTSSKVFDVEMTQLFLKGRRYYDIGTDAYGRVTLLQRLYNALTSSAPPSGPPYISNSNFSSVRAGPGTARPLSAEASDGGVPGVTTFRVSTKDRTFVEELCFKGWRFRLGDWVHMSNADDPSRPIVGQVFRCFVSDEPATKGKPGLTVCWYYRPEQTVHPAHRLFWENEVFKTSHFADHTLEDAIERIALQFTARHIRGRPRPPFWSRGWPLYVCDSRYNDRERCFVKIKNWASCVPEEVRRQRGWMPIYPFERLVYPRRHASPFVRSKAIRGPGGIGDSVERAEGEKIEGGGTGRKRARKGGAGLSSATDLYGPSKGLYVGGQSQAPPHAMSTSAHHSHQLPPPPQGAPYAPQQGVLPPRLDDRSILQAAGGAAVAGSAVLERLPPETARYFDRDGQTNEVLWFSAPPMNVARMPGPRHSLAYLHFLAMKRKAADEPNDGEEVQAKKARMPVPETATQRIARVLAEVEI